MRAHIPGRYAALALLLGGLACAGNKASDDGSVVAKDTTQAQDTSAYKGMERDTSTTDTTSYKPSAPTDTTSYQPAPAPAPAPTDTTSYKPAPAPADTTSQVPAPAPSPNATDTTGGMVHDSTNAR
jgi:hypothetical protein